jgi:hypothetical protein
MREYRFGVLVSMVADAHVHFLDDIQDVLGVAIDIRQQRHVERTFGIVEAGPRGNIAAFAFVAIPHQILMAVALGVKKHLIMLAIMGMKLAQKGGSGLSITIKAS